MLLSSMLIALIWQTIRQSSMLYSAEAFIILTLGIGSSATTVFTFDEETPSVFAPKYNNTTGTSLLGIIARLLNFSGFSGYMLWFWFVGIEDMAPLNGANCVSYGWVFVRVRLLGRFRIFNKGLAIMCAAGCAYEIIRWMTAIANETRLNGWRWIAGRMLDSLDDERDEAVALATMDLHTANQAHQAGAGIVTESDMAEARSRIAHLQDESDGSSESLQSLPGWGRSATLRRVLSPSDPHPPRPSSNWLIVAVVYLFYIAPWAYDFTPLSVFIAVIEMTIRSNHISGVNLFGSTGQLIPLITGAGSIVKVGVEWAKRERKRNQRKKRRQAQQEHAQEAGGAGEAQQEEDQPDTRNPEEGITQARGQNAGAAETPAHGLGH
jgi:hypothetical protein